MLMWWWGHVRLTGGVRVWHRVGRRWRAVGRDEACEEVLSLVSLEIGEDDDSV